MDPKITMLLKHLLQLHTARQELRKQHPFKVRSEVAPIPSRKNVASVILAQLKKLYTCSVTQQRILDDAQRLEKNIYEHGLYNAGMVKLRKAIEQETKKYARVRNNRAEDQKRIRRSIDRLLAFIHAKNCKDDDCKNPQYKQKCKDHKKLYNHTMSCKNNDCKTDHCTSSKYIIAHWHNCKNKNKCLACGNVMEAIRKQKVAENNRRRTTYKHNLVRDTHDLLRVFSQTQFRKHFQAIRDEGSVFYTKDRLKTHFLPLIEKLAKLEYGWLFTNPVDTEAWDIAHYDTIVTVPMHLNKIKVRLEQGRYTSKPPSGELRMNIARVFKNAILFNKPKHMIFKIAKDYLKIFNDEFDDICATLNEEEAQNRKNPDHCALCGGGSIMLEPLVLWCKDCGCKIQRNSNFYVSNMATNTQTCDACYRRMSKDLKASLQKRVHNQTPQEDWIECDRCKRWFHQICGLFNSSKVPKIKAAEQSAIAATAPVSDKQKSNVTKNNQKPKAVHVRTNKNAAIVTATANIPGAKGDIAKSTRGPTIKNNDGVHYTCPLCVYQERCRMGAEEPNTGEKYRGAGFLPEDNMTRAIEKRLNYFLRDQMNQCQKKQGDAYDKSQFARVKVRCVSNLERIISESTTKKSALLFEWLKERNNYEINFKGRSKMLLLFQERDGVDILFFAMYVQEYDETTAHEPNKKTCYISYLDSVKYFRPLYLRTSLYYELLLSYFKWVKKRGFTRCYIWVCPPNEKNGDDYILYCHPKTQQVPTEDRLRTWYRNMVMKGHERGIVSKCQNLTDAHLAEADDCAKLPYFTGDYWPQIAEILIKDLPKPPAPISRPKPNNSEPTQNNLNSSLKPESEIKKTPTSSRRGTRSSAVELVGALANKRQRDVLVKKLSLKIGSADVRDNFMVIDFFDTCAHCKKFIIKGTKKYACQQCNNQISKNWAEYTWGKKKKGGKVSNSGSNIKRTRKRSANGTIKRNRDSGRTPRSTRKTSSGRVSRESHRSSGYANHHHHHHHHHHHEVESLMGQKKDYRRKEKLNPFVLCEDCHGKHALLPTEKQHPVNQTNVHELTELTVESTLASTQDVDEQLSSEIFNEREDLLTLCQTNHYQFDQIRRAKHSTMMFLYHIFNPESMRDALPATCDECGQQINGPQYRCNTCTDYDMCMKCYKKGVKHEVKGKRHELRLHDPSSEPNVFVERRIQQQQTQKRLRLNSMLVHATACRLGLKWPNTCKYGKWCYKLGTLVRHWVSCPMGKTDRRKCHLCVQLHPILESHFKLCRNRNCLVPQCKAHQVLFKRAVQRQGINRMSRRPIRSDGGSSTSLTTTQTTTKIAATKSTPTSSTSSKENKVRPSGSRPTTIVLSSNPKKRKQSKTASIPQVKQIKSVSV